MPLFPVSMKTHGLVVFYWNPSTSSWSCRVLGLVDSPMTPFKTSISCPGCSPGMPLFGCRKFFGAGRPIEEGRAVVSNSHSPLPSQCHLECRDTVERRWTFLCAQDPIIQLCTVSALPGIHCWVRLAFHMVLVFVEEAAV